MTLGATFGLLRYVGMLSADLEGVSGVLSVVVTLGEPLLAAACALVIGSLFANGKLLPGAVGAVISAVPGIVLAFSGSEKTMLLYAIIPAAAACVLGFAVGMGTDRSAVVGFVSLVCAVGMSAVVWLSLNALAKANSTDFSGLVSMFAQNALKLAEPVFESEQFASIAQSNGMSEAALRTTYKEIFSSMFRTVILLIPGFFYAIYSLWTYFLSAMLEHTVELKRARPEISDIAKNMGVGEIHIRIVRQSPGYDSEYNVSYATTLVFGAAYLITLIGTLFGLPSVVLVCASLFVVALTPTFMILGYKALYGKLRPIIGTLTAPVIAVVSLVLAGSGTTFLLVSMFGIRYARKKEAEIRQKLK